jgi:transposase-like protein
VSRPKLPARRELWRQRIAHQESSGQSIRAFCRDHKLSEHSFYLWRRQLSAKAVADTPVRFALVDTTKPQPPAQHLELLLASGERLRIPADAATLRLVLSVLSEPRP